MKHWTALKTSAAAAACLTGSAVFADVGAQDVWGAWKQQMEQYGYAVTADESRSGGVLDLSNIAMHITMPENEGTLDVMLERMSFREKGDGTVEIVMPASLPVRVHVEPKGEEVVDLIVNYDTQGMVAVVSGDPGDLTYTYSAAAASLVLANLVVDGKPVDLGQIALTLTNVSGRSATRDGAIIEASQSFAAETLAYNVDVTDPEGSGEKVLMQGNLNGLQGSGTSATPENIDMQDMAAALRAGFGFDFGLTHQGGQHQFESTGGEDQFKGSSSSTSGALRVAMSAGRLIYDVLSTGSSVEVQSMQLPLPVSFQMAEAGFRLSMPLAKSDDLQDFQLKIGLSDFTMADMLWGIFDPMGQLPRDPATVAVDISGQVKLTHDLMDEKAMTALGDQPPGEIHAATISGLNVRAVGAELTGDGAFTFDNTDLTSFDGVPRPQGELNLYLVGANALLDKLVAMGFVPEDQAMGARMMMGLFAVPGDAPDTLKSKIEVNDQGHVLANGQRLK
ncbi:DUF2125 domain-containing protein [Thalassovita sp.]|uniref:DUF2125 domain-containing protein n=1 Tax=Thalassovita sp. TaxID=1979401 RepID=UPI0029DE8CBE|nr:DUF2125 domain-containing protein [Thalassovita sp.]